jgi:hypothetical protein
LKRTERLFYFIAFRVKGSKILCVAYTKSYRCRWKDNVKMALIGYKGVGRSYLIQDMKQWWALVNVVMNLSVP